MSSAIGEVNCAQTARNRQESKSREESAYILLEPAVLQRQSLHARRLAAGELIHARVIGIIHEVLDWIESWAGTRVETDGAAERWFPLGRRVGYEVIVDSGASALERVKESEPMATARLRALILPNSRRCSTSRELRSERCGTTARSSGAASCSTSPQSWPKSPWDLSRSTTSSGNCVTVFIY